MLAVIYNETRGISAIDKQLKGTGIDTYFIPEQSIPLIRKRWKILSEQIIDQYTRVLLVGEKLAYVILPQIATKEDERKASIDIYHGALVEMGGTIYVPTYLETNSITAQYRKNDIKRFLSAVIPDLPPIYPKLNFDKYVYIDIETEGLDTLNTNITSLQLANDRGEVAYIYNDIKRNATNLFQEIKTENKIVVGHNLIFDLTVLSKLTGENWFTLDINDTMLISKARGNIHNSLKHLASKYNTKYHPLSYKLQGEYNKSYAVADVLATRELHRNWLAKGLREIDNLSFDSLKTFGNARLRGLYVNRSLLEDVYSEIQSHITLVENSLKTYADITWTNNNDVSRVLLSLGIPLKNKTKTGKYSVSEDALEKVSHYPVIQSLLEYRKLKKLLSSFYEEYINSTKYHPFLYPTIKVLGTETGRTSCAKPNAQQIPLQVRKIFTSRFEGGQIGVFDLDRSELVCAVLLSGDEVMAKALKEYDYHKFVAATAFGVPYDQVSKEQRNIAKVLTFGALLYGGSAKGIAEQTGTTEEIVQSGIIELKKGFKKLTSWQEKQIATSLEYLRVIDAFGKIRELTLVNEFKFGRGSVKRAAMNTGIQGLSGYICLILANYLFNQFNRRGLRSIVILQVHDEIIIDVHPDEIEQIQELVNLAFKSLGEHPVVSKLPGYPLIQPTGELKIANSWYEAKGD